MADLTKPTASRTEKQRGCARWSTLLLIAASAALPMCTHEDHSTPRARASSDEITGVSASPYGAEQVQPHAHGGGPVSMETSVTELAKAACERADRCNEIGVDRLFGTHDDCQSSSYLRHRDELFSTCPEGIPSGALRECIDALSAERSCERRGESLRMPMACKPAALCGG